MSRSTLVPVHLHGGRVTNQFRVELFEAARRAGVSVNEFVLHAAGEKLARNGAGIVGVFEPGDLDQASNDNHGRVSLAPNKNAGNLR
jgi:hypothetical protein